MTSKPMKKIVLSIILCLCALGSVQAQNAQVANIRKMYAEAKEIIANKKKAEVPPDETVVTSNYMAPGAGPIKDVTHYFYSGEYDENLRNVYYTPYFITRSYNVGARDYYEEFLFDKGSLVFYFSKSQNDETRYYFGAGGFFHEVIKGEKQMDEVFASRLANDLVEAFHRLMNREY
jgi:hypothetical protein